MDDIVIGIDSSTQSTKAIAWSRTGELIAEGRSPIDISNPRHSWFEQKCQAWWDSCQRALKELTAQIDSDRIAGISISNQRETITFLDRHGKEVRPAMVWLDERAHGQVVTLAREIGADVIHDITGRPVDITPPLYRVAWLKKNEPAAFEKTAFFTDVHAYLVFKLCGHLKTGWISADPMGYFDIRKKEWSSTLLEYLDILPGRLPSVFPPGTLLGKVSGDIAVQTGLAENTPIFAGGGDGQCAALGTDCTVVNQAYLNLGTAVVSGVWSPDCINSHAWRTEISATGNGYILETCLRSGAFLINWFADQFLPGDRSEKFFFSALEKKVKDIPIGSDGLITLPYWSGVMNPHWDPKARGCFIGLSGSHSPEHLYRSILEGICLYLAEATRLMEKETDTTIEQIVAIGGGASSPLWVQMLADVMGKPIAVSDTLEASSLGAAMIAGYGAGWFETIEAAAGAMRGGTRQIAPDLGDKKRWDKLLSIHSRVYADNAHTFKELNALAEMNATADKEK
jgi:xylulokinase